MNSMNEKLFHAGDVIFREGDTGSCFYQILDGVAGAYLDYGEPNQRKLTDMMPGQFFGEMAVIDACPRTTTVVAEKDLRVVEISEQNLNDYFSEKPEQILAIMKQLSSRIRSLTEEYEEVNLFLKEKQDEAAPKKESFLSRMKKYADINRRAAKLSSLTAEDVIKEKADAVPAGSPLPVLSFPKGRIIFREGDEGLYMYAVHGGSVGIYAGYCSVSEKKLTSLYSGTFFGEMGMIDNEKRSATAVVEEDNTILETIGADDLQNLFRTNPMEINMILTHLSNRLRRLTVDYVKACEAAVKDN